MTRQQNNNLTIGVFITICAAIFVMTLPSCVYNVEEVLYPSDNCDTSATFSGTIRPIFDQNCNQCHATDLSFGGITLDDYDEVKSVINANRLLGSIRHDDGFSPMPQGNPKLSDCNIAKIQAWINAGALNN